MAGYRLSNAAEDDLIRIHQYGILRFGEIQADKYFDSFFKCFDIIAERPLAFESVDHIRTGYRRCVCGVDSVFYRIQNETVEIMAIIGKQELDKLFK